MSAEHPIEVPDFSKEDLEAIRAGIREAVREGMEPLRQLVEALAATWEKAHQVVELLEKRKVGK